MNYHIQYHNGSLANSINDWAWRQVKGQSFNNQQVKTELSIHSIAQVNNALRELVKSGDLVQLSETIYRSTKGYTVRETILDWLNNPFSSASLSDFNAHHKKLSPSEIQEVIDELVSEGLIEKNPYNLGMYRKVITV